MMTNGNTASTNQTFLITVVALALAFALNEILPDDAKPWILITLGVLALGYVLRQFLLHTDRGKSYLAYLKNLDKSYYWVGLGGLILLVGITARFTPADVGMALSIAGVMLLLSSIIYFLRSSNVLTTRETIVTPAPITNYEAIPNKAYPITFKERITEEVLGHARRASMLSFSVAVGLFIIGIGIFLFIAISIYQMLNGEAGALLFSSYLSNYFSGSRSGLPDIESVGLLFLVQLLAFFPIIGLILIGWIGSKFIMNATRLSQRKAIQDTLTEMGPLDAILSGVAISQPPVEAMHRNLKLARRALAARRFFSTLLLLAGLGLLGWMIIDGTLYGFKDFTKIMIIGITGGTLLLISIFFNNPSQTRRALQDITKLEMDIAQSAQRAQIVNLYVAHLAKDGFKNQDAGELKKVLENLNVMQTAGIESNMV